MIVPPSWEGERNDLALAAASAHPDRFAVMGRLDTEAAGARDATKSQHKTWIMGRGLCEWLGWPLPPSA